MKIKGFLKDVTGASRVTKARLNAFATASATPQAADPIAAVVKEWHPGRLALVVTDVRETGKTAKTVRFARADGAKLPFFYAGQFMVLDFEIDGAVISRPYSISSAPYQARQENGFAEITVRRSRGDGFIADYINDNVKIGDSFTGLIGCGQFYYEPLRDAKHVVALAGGVGITPFASMAKVIANGTLDFDLTILYGSVAADDILLKEELEALKSDKVHVVHVLSGDDPAWQGEKGFLTAELIKKYSAPDTTYFICGPQAIKDKTFSLTVRRGLQEDVIPAKATESLVVALERAGIRIETACRSGECGFCRTKVLAGSVYICPENDGRRAADKDFNYVHACAAYPTSDVTIKIPIE